MITGLIFLICCFAFAFLATNSEENKKAETLWIWSEVCFYVGAIFVILNYTIG